MEDSKAKGRNNYIQTLLETQKTLIKHNADTQVVWIGASVQPELEKVFSIDFNYPSIVVVSNTKNVYGK